MNHIGVLSTVSYHPEEGHEMSLAYQTSAKRELTTIRRIYGVLNDISDSISFDIERRVHITDTHHPYAAIGGSRTCMDNAIYEYQHQSSLKFTLNVFAAVKAPGPGSKWNWLLSAFMIIPPAERICLPSTYESPAVPKKMIDEIVLPQE